MSQEQNTVTQAGTALTDSFTVSLDGIRWLRTVAAAHAVCFSCSGCQKAFPLSNNGNEAVAIWMRDTLVHLAGHWHNPTTSAGTDWDWRRMEDDLK